MLAGALGPALVAGEAEDLLQGLPERQVCAVQLHTNAMSQLGNCPCLDFQKAADHSLAFQLPPGRLGQCCHLSKRAKSCLSPGTRLHILMPDSLTL